jgi:hypothetical protein
VLTAILVICAVNLTLVVLTTAASGLYLLASHRRMDREAREHHARMDRMGVAAAAPAPLHAVPRRRS